MSAVIGRWIQVYSGSMCAVEHVFVADKKRCGDMIYQGEILGGTYQVIKQIGRGGSGLVFLAYHRNLRKYVVIKRVQMGVGNLEALRAETDILKNLRHTNIPQVYDYLVRDGEVFTVMDYIEGTSVDDLPAGNRQLPENMLVNMLLQLSGVLSYLHKNKPPVIHSDIKPDNLILTKDGNLCLIDFNISVTTGVSASLSGYSMHFASPEQYRRIMDIRARAKDITSLDARTDIYSTGAVFYYLMTGCYPDTRQPRNRGGYSVQANRTGAAMAGQPAGVLFHDMLSCGYSDALCSVVARCLEQNRNLRYADGGSLHHAVRNLRRQDRKFRRYVLLRAVSWLLSAALIGGGCYYLIKGKQQENINAYEAKLHSFTEAYEHREEEAQTIGNEILNDSAYKDIQNDRPADSIMVLQCLGDLAVEKEDFENAQEYYKDVLEIAKKENTVTSRMYRDYAKVLVQNGYIARAREILQEGGVDNADSAYIQAYISLKEGNIDACIKTVEEILAMGADHTLCADACVLAADACKQMEGMSTTDSGLERIGWLEKATMYSGDAVYQRLLGAEYWNQVGDTRNTELEWEAYARKAVHCYEKVTSLPNSGTDDMISRVIAMQYLGDYAGTTSLLTPLLQSRAKDYRIPAYLSLAYDGMGIKTEASGYASMALQLYEENNGYSADSELIDRLKAIDASY